MTGEIAAVGIDIGGTNMRAGAVTIDGEIVEQRRAPTPADDPTGLIAAVADVASIAEQVPIGIGIAALVEPDGTVRYGPNIGVRDVALAATLGGITGRPVTVVNDAAAAAFGEYRAGAARDVDDMVLLTVGTGIGGGIVVGGRLLLGAQGLATEIGHIAVGAGTRQCTCGLTGCLEAYASATSIVAIVHEAIAAGATTRLVADGSLTASQIARAAEAGDPLARDAVGQAARHIGDVLATLVTTLDPARILLGGGAGPALADVSIPVIAAQMRRRVFGAAFRTLPDVRLAALGDDAGTVGAALLAAQNLDEEMTD